MSTNIEESPLSDSKMDISDTTNSMESAGVSPVVEHNHNDTAQHAYKVSSTFLCSAINNDDSQDADKEKVAMDTQVECILNENKELQSHSNKQAIASHLQALDNRYAENMCRPGTLTLSEKHLSSLTVANSHPLMSPTGTDSDSENSCLVQKKVNHAFNNYPDVVPNRERNMVPEPTSQVIKLQTTNTMAMNQKVDASSIVLQKNSLNCNNPMATVKNKPSMLRTHSPDLLSSGSEADASQYYAAVEANFQSVALIPNTNNANTIFAAGRQSKRPGDVVATGSDDISSLDSISNHSFDDDEDLEHNLASLSPSSSLIDGLDDDDDDCEGPEIEDDFPEGSTPTNSKPADSLPQYSAEDERRDSRNWQKITLPDGSTREIDMKVIEPYKRVLSHGGYLKAGGHNAIVIFCACHLPDRSRADYHYVMDNLFLYVVKTLDQLVTEDYVLIYLHGGTSRRNVPPFPWLKKCYQLLDRRLRKSLKSMYLVHPTFWIKSIVWMARPFVSAKFWRKLIYVKSLHELGTHVAVERAAIPEKVKQYDAKIN